MSDKAAAVSKVMEMIKEHSVEYVDFRFTDPKGKWQHTAQHVSTVDEDNFVDGIMFGMMALVLIIKPSGLLGREPAR